VATVDDGLCLELLDKYRTAGVDVAVWNATSDVGICCFVCWILDRGANDFRRIGLAQGAGCHPNRGVALARALTEAAQSRLTRVVGSRDDMNDGEIDSLKSEATTVRHRASMQAPMFPPTHFATVPSYDLPTFEDDLSMLQGRLRSVDLDSIVVVDLTREDGLSVVRVVVPGLEAPYYLPGYAPGRRALGARAHRSGK
jgi:ribosomal protein S12 methylthiotransferase accessory factor